MAADPAPLGLLPAEAAEVLCPQMLHLVTTDAVDPPRICLCRGPRCMAFRFLPGDGTELRRRGYCGLAGPLAGGRDDA